MHQDALSLLVCPHDLTTLSRTGEQRLQCANGHAFAVENGIPNLVIAESMAGYLHHVPTNRGGYEDLLRPAPGGRRDGRWRLRIEVARAARYYRTTVDRSWAVLPAELKERKPPEQDRFREIHGATRFTHELTKRLEKQMFWDDVQLPEPACELGVHTGHSSRYFFGDRPLGWGSNYVPATMRRPRSDYAHANLFAANIKFLPFPDGHLASLCCSQTLTVAYASIGSILAEANRVLAVGGRFAFVTHGPAFRRALPRDGWPDMRLSADECRRRTLERADYMSQLYTLDEWTQLLQAHGFDVELSRGLLSTDYARFVQLFYVREMVTPPIFTAPFQTRRMRALKALCGMSARAEAETVTRLERMMGAIMAHEMERHRNAPFRDEAFMDAGIVATKRRHSDLPRIAPRL